MTPWSNIPVGEHLFLFSPMLALTATMLAVVTCPLIVGRSPRAIAITAALGIVATFLLSLRVADAVAAQGVSGLSTQPTAGLLVADNLSAVFQIILIAFLGAVTYLWWLGSAVTERNAPEFFVLLFGSALGMTLMVSTSNLLMIVIAIEVASLPSYAMVGFDKRDRLGAEASLKYVIFGAVCAAIMLYGASLLYGLVGSLSVADVARYVVAQFAVGENRLLTITGLLCFLAGIAFKISAFPFHFWCPDAFEGAKIEVTTWLSVVSKAAGLILLTRLVMTFCAAVDDPVAISLIHPLAWAIGIMAAVTCTVGNFAAYKQRSVKRLLAYSSIAHAGYMMMACAVFVHPASREHASGLSALIVYVVIYLFMNLGAFGVTAMIAWDTGSDRIDAFTGLIRRAPWLAVPMVICLMSLVGLPPFAGFIGKWWILVALGNLGSVLGWFLVITAVLNTLFSLYFYLRIVVQMTLRDDNRAGLRSPLGGIALVNFCAVALVALFVLAQPFQSVADRFSRSFFSTTTILHTDADTAAALQHFGNQQDSDDPAIQGKIVQFRPPHGP